MYIDEPLSPPPTKRDLTICHLNAQSIMNKHDEISNYLSNQTSPTILGISETWLNKNTPDSLINIEGYTTYRLDRQKSRGGGLVVYVPNTLKATLREDLDNHQMETIWIELNLNRQTILLCNLYRPPNSGIAFFDHLDSMIESSLNCRKEVILMGDFNCNVMTSNSLSSNLLSVTDGHQLTQIISGPTRITNHSKTIIDLCFTSSPNSLSYSGTTPLTSSDHLMIHTRWANCVDTPNNVTRMIRSFKRTDMEELSEDLRQAPWSVMSCFDDINDMWDHWKGQFINILDKHAPLTKVRTKKYQLKWITKETHSLMRARNYFLNRHRKSNTTADWNQYVKYRNRVKINLKINKKNHFEGLCKDLRGKPRQVWTELNRALGRKTKSRITHINKDGKSVILPMLIAESLNKHFSTLQTKAPASTNSQLNYLNPSKTQFHFKRIDEDEVCACLTKLNTRKATGGDGITAGMLQKCARDISPGLTTLFNHSLTTGKLPAEWKRANVTPIQKAPNDHQLNNYRPISVLPIIVKVMEQIIHKQLYTYMVSSNQISHYQSGFRPAHSTQERKSKTGRLPLTKANM